MKTIRYIKCIAVSALLFSGTACSYFEVEDATDPNRPSVEGFQRDATVAQLNLLANGVAAQLRNSYGTNAPYHQVTGTLGREIYQMNDTENRWLTELLGALPLDNAAFYSAAAYNQNFITARAARNLILSTDASPNVTEAQKQGLRGYANTIQALALLQALNLMGENGIRINLNDPRNPGPFVTHVAALTEIKRLLDEGATQLAAAGTSFAVTLPSGFEGFDTPATFLQFNRGLAARVAVYQENWTGALNALNASFLNLNASTQADLDAGPKVTYSQTSPDVTNPLFQTLNSAASSVTFAHPSFVADAEAGDLRLSKVGASTNPKSISDLNGIHESRLYTSNTDPITIIDNEELVLIYAEAKAQNNALAEAEDALNTIRTVAGGLPDYVGPATKDALIDEMLKQRRYSLWYQGHRWVDMRRYDRLDDLPLDKPTHTVHAQLRKPQNETAWDDFYN